MALKWEIAKRILMLGLTGFCMKLTNSAVQVSCNATLQLYGGDLYVGVMTVVNSVRDVLMMPISGLSSGSEPFISYNYGAGEYAVSYTHRDVYKRQASISASVEPQMEP